MKYIPKKAALDEAIYRDIDKNVYLNEIYEALLYNYSLGLFGLDRPQKQIQIKDALRFADLLSKSTYAPTADRDHQWGQEIATLLHLVYPQDETVKYYLGSVLSAVGNYRGLKSPTVEGYKSADVLEVLVRLIRKVILFQAKRTSTSSTIRKPYTIGWAIHVSAIPVQHLWANLLSCRRISKSRLKKVLQKTLLSLSPQKHLLTKSEVICLMDLKMS